MGWLIPPHSFFLTKILLIMIKTYKLTTPLRNLSIVLRGKTGNSLRYNFSGGDPLTGKAATIMLRSQYSQDLLESSEAYANGYIVLAKIDKGGEDVSAPKDEKTVIEEVSSPEQLLEFVAENLDKVYKNAKAALDYAKRQGFEFPNLTIE